MNNASFSPDTASSRREFDRLEVRCRARIRIGKREYAGFVENISDGGAKIVTLTPISGFGPVYLKVPDLPPMSGQLRWMGPLDAGVCFNLRASGSVLQEWARSRLNGTRCSTDRSIEIGP